MSTNELSFRGPIGPVRHDGKSFFTTQIRRRRFTTAWGEQRHAQDSQTRFRNTTLLADSPEEKVEIVISCEELLNIAISRVRCWSFQ